MSVKAGFNNARPEEFEPKAVDDEINLGWAWGALREVIDPELGLDVVALGLIYDVRVDDNVTVVEMTLTTPGCPASESLVAMAHYAVSQADTTDRDVDVRIVWDPAWSPAMIDEDAAAARGFHIRRQ